MSAAVSRWEMSAMWWKLSFVFGPYLILLVLAGYAFLRRKDAGGRRRGVFLVWMTFCLSKFLAFDRLGGNSFCPALPEKLIWFWDWAYSGAIIYCALAVLACFFRFRGKMLTLCVLAWGTSVWGIYNGLSVPDVNTVELEFAELPRELDGYRIVQLADLHASHAARRARTQAVVDAVNALDVDLVCLTGDNADGQLEAVRDYVEPLGELRARDGVFACTGNHEYYFGYGDWLRNFYLKLGNLRILTNECVFPRRGLALGGMPDITGSIKGIDQHRDVDTTFASATNGEFRVLLSHRPSDAHANFLAGVRLQLSGHTHGGIAPLMRGLIARFNGGFARGMYRVGESVLYVSPGCGQWGGFPIRFFNPSEITYIILRRSAEGQIQGEEK